MPSFLSYITHNFTRKIVYAYNNISYSSMNKLGTYMYYVYSHYIYFPPI